jgi:hypothetical protein
VGTTIKTDGLESDPFAFLTVLNMHVHHVSLIIRNYVALNHPLATSVNKGYCKLLSAKVVH